MKKYELLGLPIHVGEVYNNNGNLYRVESFDDDCVRPSIHLHRIKDGWELDVRGAALYLTDRGVELLWAYSNNGHFAEMEAMK